MIELPGFDEINFFSDWLYFEHRLFATVNAQIVSLLEIMNVRGIIGCREARFGSQIFANVRHYIFIGCSIIRNHQTAFVHGFFHDYRFGWQGAFDSPEAPYDVPIHLLVFVN